MDNIPELKEKMNIPNDMREMPKVYLVWSVNRVSHEIELCAITSGKKRAKRYAKVIKERGELENKQLRPEIEDRQINHLFASDMMGDNKEWNKKSGKNLESGAE